MLSSLGCRSCCSQQRSSSSACRSRACERACFSQACFRFLLAFFPARRGTGRGAHGRGCRGRSGPGRASSHGPPVGRAGRCPPCPNGAPLEIFGRVARREEAAGASRWGLGSENRPSRRCAENNRCQAPGIFRSVSGPNSYGKPPIGRSQGRGGQWPPLRAPLARGSSAVEPQLCSPVQLRNGQIEVWHQRISISCWAGACAVGRCGRRMSVKNMQCDQRGARSGARRERRPSPFPSCTRPRLCVVVKGGGQRTRREQQRSPAPMGGQLTLVGFSAVGTYRGRP